MEDDSYYQPPSDFLRSVIAEEITFGEHAFGRMNLARLIALTRDAEDANRDWATMLLAQTGEDSPEIRQAFIDRLDDPHEETALEALVGLAERDRAAALPVVRRWLKRDEIVELALEAAALVADAALTPVLEEIAARRRSTDPPAWLVEELEIARMACASGVPPD